MIKRFKLSVPQKTLNDIYSKVRKYPWKNIQNMAGWEYGTNYKYLKEISKYWVTKFNWRKQEKKINSFYNFLTKVDGINIHFIKEKGSGSNPIPVVPAKNSAATNVPQHIPTATLTPVNISGNELGNITFLSICHLDAPNE